jgi:hypothetical protein
LFLRRKSLQLTASFQDQFFWQQCRYVSALRICE